MRNNQVSPPIDIPMTIISRQEYNMLGSKSSTGFVNSIFYQPLVSTGVVSLFLTPDSNVATNYTLYMTVKRSIMDVNLSTDNFDLPAEWYLPLIWILTAEMSSDYEKSLQDKTYFDQKALFYKTQIEDYDIEDVSVKFIPDVRSNTSGFK